MFYTLLLKIALNQNITLDNALIRKNRFLIIRDFFVVALQTVSDAYDIRLINEFVCRRDGQYYERQVSNFQRTLCTKYY